MINCYNIIDILGQLDFMETGLGSSSTEGALASEDTKPEDLRYIEMAGKGWIGVALSDDYQLMRPATIKRTCITV